MIAGFVQPAAAHQYHAFEEIPFGVAAIPGDAVENLFGIGYTVSRQQPAYIGKR